MDNGKRKAPAIPEHDPATETLGEWLRKTQQIAKDHPSKADAIRKARAKILQSQQ